MKKVTIKRGSRECSKEIGGCGRSIKQGEVAYLKLRSGRQRYKRAYLCKDCYKVKAY
jgi:hypothetical protein